MIAFIDEDKRQEREPDRRSARANRDEALMPEIHRAFDDNYGVYGVHKVWKQLLREGFVVAKCTVRRLMRLVGLRGTTRGKALRSQRSPTICWPDLRISWSGTSPPTYQIVFGWQT